MQLPRKFAELGATSRREAPSPQGIYTKEDAHVGVLFFGAPAAVRIPQTAIAACAKKFFALGELFFCLYSCFSYAVVL